VSKYIARFLKFVLISSDLFRGVEVKVLSLCFVLIDAAMMRKTDFICD
jgi:hypothetical protein